MIPFIFLIIVVIFGMLLVSYFLKIYTLGVLSSISMVIMGIYVLINGVEGIRTIMVSGLGTISVCLGFYIFIRGSIEKFREG